MGCLLVDRMLLLRCRNLVLPSFGLPLEVHQVAVDVMHLGDAASCLTIALILPGTLHSCTRQLSITSVSKLRETPLPCAAPAHRVNDRVSASSVLWLLDGCVHGTLRFKAGEMYLMMHS